MPAKMVSVNVTLGPSGVESRSETLAKLKSAGLREATHLEAIGVVSGRVPQGKLKALAQVPGVTVEIDETVTIPPPDSPTQ
jgi:hypothetical protein